jgi:hypothetical protein
MHCMNRARDSIVTHRIRSSDWALLALLVSIAGFTPAVFAEVGSSDSPPFTIDNRDCVGDVTGDHLIGLDDLSRLLSHFGILSGAVYGDGDLDGDGDIDLNDLAVLLSNFGTPCS